MLGSATGPAAIAWKSQSSREGREDSEELCRRCGKRRRLRLAPERYRQLTQKILEPVGWRCQHSGRRNQLQIHHIIRRSQLEADGEETLIVLCGGCNHWLRPPAGMRSLRRVAYRGRRGYPWNPQGRACTCVAPMSIRTETDVSWLEVSRRVRWCAGVRPERPPTRRPLERSARTAHWY